MHILNQADDEDQKYLLGKLLWVFLLFIVRFLGIIISSVGTEQDFRPGGFPLEVGVIGFMPQSSGAAVLGWV